MYNIGDIIDYLVITNREMRMDKNGRNWCWCKYTCTRCGWTEGWVVEHSLNNNTRCACCCSSPRVVVEGINDIPTTAPEMVKYFQGGYDEAKLYTKSSGKVINPICPDCKRVKSNGIRIYTIYKEKSIGCACQDSISYPTKLLMSIFNQLGLKYITELTKKTVKWCEKYRYDFWINDKIIVEAHGMQHYTLGFSKTNKSKSLENTIANDKVKQELALRNGVKKYVVIDCRYSNLEFIKDNILNSVLSELFDLSNIDWNKAGEFAMSNLSKEICQYWNSKNEIETVKDVSDKFHVNRVSITKYLKLWTELGLCNYDPKLEKDKSVINNGIRNKEAFSKKILVLKDGEVIDSFNSLMDLDRCSVGTFGVKLDYRNVSSVALGKLKQYKGYTFKYA